MVIQVADRPSILQGLVQVCPELQPPAPDVIRRVHHGLLHLVCPVLFQGTTDQTLNRWFEKMFGSESKDGI